MKHNTKFRHESLQDKESIKRLLRALTSGISKGKLTLEDEDGTMVMEPRDLLNFKISASQDEEKNTVNIRLSWNSERNQEKNKKINIKAN